jgi:uncharacterized protein (TIGR02265 family)
MRYGSAVPVANVARALEVIAPHCDITQRLVDVPPSARIRGLYLNSTIQVLKRAGKLALYEEFFAGERWSPISFYPLSDYLVRLALAGSGLTSPARLHDGMKELTRRNSIAFASSVLGRVLLRILSRNPAKLTEQALAGRRQSTNYGEWSLLRHGETDLEIVKENEYIWIESALLGAALGTYEACDAKPVLTVKLRSRYSGSIRIRW